jgi:hypothetical protein
MYNLHLGYQSNNVTTVYLIQSNDSTLYLSNNIPKDSVQLIHSLTDNIYIYIVVCFNLINLTPFNRPIQLLLTLFFIYFLILVDQYTFDRINEPCY